jgi:probable HAF family extracellular repeat protein
LFLRRFIIWLWGERSPQCVHKSHVFRTLKSISSRLGTLGGPDSFVVVRNHTVSDRGAVIGYSEILVEDPNGEDLCGFGTFLVCLPFIWENGKMTALPTLGGTNGQALGEQTLLRLGGSAGLATAINDNGDVVGLTGRNTSTFHAVLWRHGKPIDLGSLGGVSGNVPFDLTNRDQVVGQSDLVCFGTRHLTWKFAA